MTLEKNIPEIDGLSGNEENEKVDKGSVFSIKTFVLSFGTIILVAFFVLMTRSSFNKIDVNNSRIQINLNNNGRENDELIYFNLGDYITEINPTDEIPKAVTFYSYHTDPDDDVIINCLCDDKDYVYLQLEYSKRIKKVDKTTKNVSNIEFVDGMVLKNGFCLQKEASKTIGIFFVENSDYWISNIKSFNFETNLIDHSFLTSYCPVGERPNPIVQSNDGTILIYECVSWSRYGLRNPVFFYTATVHAQFTIADNNQVIVITPDNEWVLKFKPNSLSAVIAFKIADLEKYPAKVEGKVGYFKNALFLVFNVSFSKDGQRIYITQYRQPISDKSDYQLVTIDYKKMIDSILSNQKYEESIKQIEMPNI